MENEFWHSAWAKNDQPGWQQASVNRYLQAHWAETGAMSGETVFVPLCGRSLDMQWLREQGHHVIGIDLSIKAIEDFCEQQSIDAVCERDGKLTVFRASGWTLYAGDFFKLSPELLTHVTRVYDRAALIALPPPLRESYAAHMKKILPSGAEIFVVTITYDQEKMKGPPFSVTESELYRLYDDRYRIKVLHSKEGPDLLGNLAQRGLDTVCDNCYQLIPMVSLET